MVNINMNRRDAENYISALLQVKTLLWLIEDAMPFPAKLKVESEIEFLDSLQTSLETELNKGLSLELPF